MLRTTLLAFLLAASLGHAADPKPIRALLVAGGCCHDYTQQQEILSKGIQERALVQVDVVWTDDKSVSPVFPLYQNPNWADGYDIIIHDECAAGVRDVPLVQNVLKAHEKIPAVNLHCAMHSFRTGTDIWFKYLGLQSASHNWQKPITLKFVDPEHPITKGMKDWTTINEELYNNINLFGAHPLIMGTQEQKAADGTLKPVDYVVGWTNDYKGTRIFSTTIGHNNDTVADARYLDLVTRGVLWAVDKLSDDYLKPFKGQNKVTFIKAEPKPEPPKPAAVLPPPAPKDATLVTATASSEESGKSNFAWRAVDGSEDTRWCANAGSYPQWLQLELEKPMSLTGLTMSWESKGAYQYRVEGSADGKSWTTLADGATNEKPAPYDLTFKAENTKFIRITGVGSKHGGWASIREVKLKGEGLKMLAPKMNAQQKATADKAAKDDADPYKTEGNIPPKIVKLTAEQEAAILKDVKLADGFEATVFAAPPAANYPVFIAAAPDGTVYVSSDGNGSLGRNPHRGRILRLKDTDGDGHADEAKVYCEVDSPRGLVWDHDRLYVVHPPHLSAFIDKDGDGVSDEEKVLVKDIAFGFKDRPADHTTNGLSLGIDGWLYIAGGDFGYMKATGTDGRTVQHRGGGVTRVRPDGTGLEIYSKGTRNILEVAISPTMDIFSRDNTNDGGGWNVRFHHFTGLDNHGYPRLYKNFADEAIAPLADYGGGSGCGAVYIDEPGFGTWNNAPFTADWGTGALYKHSVKPNGATYVETEAPQPFIKMTRPTDADVDAMSRVYCASWKGATFNWEGPDVGYIVCVKPKGFKPEALPDFAKASDAELVKVLESPSNRRRMEASRELVRRKATGEQSKIAAIASNKAAPLGQRVAAVATLTRLGSEVAPAIVALAADPTIQAEVIRCFDYTPEGLKAFGDRKAVSAILDGWLSGKGKDSPMQSTDARIREAALLGLSEFGDSAAISHAQALLTDADPVVKHSALQAFALTPSGVAHAIAILKDSQSSPELRNGALLSLAKVHQADVVTALIEQLAATTDSAQRRPILSALCRLNFHEGEWAGDSWGTRPDTRGPYYQPEAWSETPKIAAALKEALSKASPEDTAFLVKEMNRNRIQSNDALERILVLAKGDAKVLPDAVAQLASAETIPAEGIPLLLQALKQPGSTSATLSQAIIALAKTDSAEGCATTLASLTPLQKIPESGKDFEAATTAFFNSPKLENHHQLIEQIAEKLDGNTSMYADAALLYLAARTSGSPESKELSGKALDLGWQNLARRKQIIDAIGSVKHQPSASRVLVALDDPDAKVKAAAERAAKSMRLQKVNDSTPKVGTLKPEDAIAAVLKTKGDPVLGEQIFARATCVACHTTSMDQAQKGPYLGNIAQTYKRPELAQNILDPNKTIAQGFASELITMKDGTQQMGFITLEGATEVKLRNIAAQEFTFKTADIKERMKLPTSMMPPGLMLNFTVREFASLLDYLEALAKKK